MPNEPQGDDTGMLKRRARTVTPPSIAHCEVVNRPPFDWVRFGIRFACGSIPGVLLGFGFWVQMCRPVDSLGLGGWLPRQVTEWLHLETTIDSGIAGLGVVLIFAVMSGTIVGLWRSGSR